MKFSVILTRARDLISRQVDQNVNAPWFVPAAFAGTALLLTLLRVDAALPLLIVATALDRYRFDIAGAGLRLEHFVFASVALGWFLKARPVWASLHFTRADLLLGAYLALALFSSLLLAPRWSESLKFLALMAFGVALYWLVRAIAATPREFVRGVWWLVVTGVGAAAYGILAWLAFPFGLDLGVQTYALENFVTVSPFGTLFDSNTLGLYAMAAALVQITLWLDPLFSKWRLGLGGGILIALVAVALSLTRAAWLGLALGLLLIVLASPRWRWALAIGGAALGLAALALLVNSALAGGGNALAEYSWARVLTSRSISFRLDAYARAWSDFLASPLLGNGANVFAQKYTSPAGTRDWISNFFLMTLHDTGVVGLVLLTAWLGWLGIKTWRALGTRPSRARTMLLGLGVAYIALVVAYQATTVFWLGFNWVYLGLLRAGTLVCEENVR